MASQGLFSDYSFGRPVDDGWGGSRTHNAEGGAVSYGPTGIPYIASAGNGGGGKEMTFLDQLMQEARGEKSAKQGAADRQFERNNREIDDLRQFVGDTPQRFEGMAEEAGTTLDDFMNQLSGFSEGQMGELKGRIEENQKSAEDRYKDEVKGIDEAVGAAKKFFNLVGDRAVETAAGAISKYARGVQEDVIQVTVAGMRRNMETTRKMIANRIGPNGEKLTLAEAAQMEREMKFDVGMQVATMAAGVRKQTQDVLAGLRTNLANVMLEVDKVKAQGAMVDLQGEAMKGQAGERLAQTEAQGLSAFLQGQEGQRAVQGMLSGLAQFKVQTKNALKLAGIDFEMNGRLAIGQAVRDNPETVIGFLSALIAMGGIATAPGGRNIPALG